MDNVNALYTGLSWLAVFLYVLATIANVAGVLFRKDNNARWLYPRVEPGEQ